MSETWRPVPAFEGLYEVSDAGRVRSLDRVVTRGGHAHQLRGVVLAFDESRVDGRRQLVLSREGRHTRTLIAPLVLTAFVGPRPAGLMACHNNGDKTDDRLVNLRWDTQSENLLDTNAHGTNHWRKRTHCPRRHALQAPNIRADAARVGHRACLACERARCLLRSAKHRGRDFQEVADECFARIMATTEVSGS